MNDALPMPPSETAAIAPPPKRTQVTPPSRWSGYLVGLGLIALGVVGGVIGNQYLATPSTEVTPGKTEEENPNTHQSVTFSKDKQTSAGIETLAVAATPLHRQIWRTGHVSLNEERLAHICPPAEGIIREVPVRIGQAVAKGDVLAVVECRELSFLKLDLLKARAALATERDNAARILATMTNAEELVKLLTAETPLVEVEKRMADKPIGDWRSQLLGAYTKRNQLKAQLASQRMSSGAIPESTLRKTEADADAASAGYVALLEELRYQVKYQIRQAELKLREAETAVDVTKGKLITFGFTPETVETIDPVGEGEKAAMLVIKAPFAGTIVEKHAVLSERVGPQFQMFVLSDLGNVWVEADIFEPDLPLIRGLTNQSITFRSTVAGIPPRQAKVVYTGDIIDPASRSMRMIAEATNGDRLLKPGMFVEVGFDNDDRTPVLQIPTSAILRHENVPFVFVAAENDQFVRTEVTLGRTAGDAVEITNGLKAGDRVVVKGGFLLKSELLKDQMVGE